MSRRLPLLITSLVLVFAFYFVSSVYATTTTYFVDKASIGGACSDTNPGTITQPFCTVNKAISLLQPGTTVYLRAGTYPAFMVTASGTESEPIVISGYEGEQVVIDATGSAYGIWLKKTHYVEISNFEVKHAGGAYNAGIFVVGDNSNIDFTGMLSSHNKIRNNKVHDNANGTNWVEGIRVLNSSHNLIENNEVYNNYNSGIMVAAHPNVAVTGNQIINNKSYRNRGNAENADGISVNGNKQTGALLKGNIVYENADDGIDTWNTSGNTVVENTAYNQQGPGNGNGFKMGGSTTGGNNTVRFNTSYNNKRNGFDSNGSGGNTYYHNVAYNNGNRGFEDGYRNSGAVGCPDTERCYGTLVSNIGFNNAIYNVYTSTQTKTVDYNVWFTEGKGSLAKYLTTGLDSHAVIADPRFTNAAQGDFRLQDSSPAVNAGDPANPAAVTVCLTAPDSGRFEYCPPPTPTPTPTPTPEIGTKYYVDCQLGNDTNTGMSESVAWKTLTKVATIALQPGDTVLLKRDCTWNHQLKLTASGTPENNITVDAYGAGNAPVITNNAAIDNGYRDDVLVSGSYITLQNLYLTATSSKLEGAGSCEGQPVGNYTGVRMHNGASYVTVQHTVFTGLTRGVVLDKGTHHNRLLSNNIYANRTMKTLTNDGGNDDSGAQAILLYSDNNEIAYNTFADNVACSYDYVLDGAAVEVFNASYNNIHHNVSKNNLTFTELGHATGYTTADNSYAYNVISSDVAGASFLITKGPGNPYGPVTGTVAYNNTVYLTSPTSFGVHCTGGCQPSYLTLQNNIIWSEGLVTQIDSAIVEGYNLFWKANGSPVFTYHEFVPASTSLIVDPLFVNAVAGDFHLQAGSPAIDAADSTQSTTSLCGDAVDIGGFEYCPSPTPTLQPTPTFTPTPTIQPTPIPTKGKKSR